MMDTRSSFEISTEGKKMIKAARTTSLTYPLFTATQTTEPFSQNLLEGAAPQNSQAGAAYKNMLKGHSAPHNLLEEAASKNLLEEAAPQGLLEETAPQSLQ